MNSVIILVDDPGDWGPYYKTDSVHTVSEYLKHGMTGKGARLVINLSNSYAYNTEGYYCSLLAQARGDRVLPGVDVINKLEAGIGTRMDRGLQKACYQWIQKNVAGEEAWYLNIYFGTCAEKGLERVARFIFDHYPCPLLRVGFNTRSRNQIESVQALPLASLEEREQDLFAAALDNFNRKVWRAPRSPRVSRFNLAILHDPGEVFPPSDKRALAKFIDVARRMNIHAELITEEESTRLMEFDALFIRATTALNHFTYHLSQKAASNGLAVIDDPLSIIRCTNKVYLNELLERERIPSPRSLLIFRQDENTFEDIAGKLGTPFVLKIPDGSFSVGMKRVNDAGELAGALEALFERSAILLAQAYTPTEFDWRVGVLDGEALYACKYYMAKGHWQIYEHHADGKRSDCGRAEAIPLYQVPATVLKTARKAAALVGRGLYGVDLKMVEEKAIVIEINDNPSIDHGVEDAILGDELYHRVLEHFARELEQKRY